MNDITVASREQSEGIDQVSQAITQMDEITQRNAAVVEEAAAAAEDMQGQAAKLGQLVNAFKLVATAPRNAPALRPVASTAARTPALAAPTARKSAKRVVNARVPENDWDEF